MIAQVILDVPTGILHAIIWYNIVEYYFKRKKENK